MTDKACDEPQAITPAEAGNSEPSCESEDIVTEAEVAWAGVPPTIEGLLCNPPVLPHESEDFFFALFESFQAYAKPETIIEWHLVYAATVCRWESDRYRFMAVAVTTNQQQAGLASLFEQTGEVGIGKLDQHLVSAQARKNAMKCLSDSDYREDAYIDFEKRGYMPDGQAFRLSLPDLATIERLLSSSEKRYAVTMKDLEKRMASRAAKPAPK